MAGCRILARNIVLNCHRYRLSEPSAEAETDRVLSTIIFFFHQDQPNQRMVRMPPAERQKPTANSPFARDNRGWCAP